MESDEQILVCTHATLRFAFDGLGVKKLDDNLAAAYLDIAKESTIRQIPMTMEDWESRLNKFIEATDREILQNAGKVTTEIAKAHAESEFEQYRIIQDRLFESDFDKIIKNQLPPKKD